MPRDRLRVSRDRLRVARDRLRVSRDRFTRQNEGKAGADERVSFT